MLFPFVEAGFGHIMPMKSIEQKFREKYGDRVEVISSQFYTETGNKHLEKYEKMIARQVRIYNKHHFVGHIATVASEVFGATLSSYTAIRMFAPFAYKAAMEHMKEISPDVVFSTHWATNYYAEHMENKPLTVMYCPDAQLNKLFEYKSDLNMISMPYGYLKALRKKQYNKQNMKIVPFLIRNEAFKYCRDKKELRRELGLPEDNFTVILAEGGYGIGKIKRISELLIKEHLPLTVIPVCGKNEKLYNYFLSLEPTKEVTFRPYNFTERILELEAASDIFCGKSGNILAEATFFGMPSIVTSCATFIEHNIADHYINTVGCAMKELSPEKTVKMIKEFAKDETLLEPYRKEAAAYHAHFGAEKAADVMWEKITEVFPELH